MITPKKPINTHDVKTAQKSQKIQIWYPRANP